MANVWMHNGFLQVEGEKMSKSLGNFITINELLATDKFGGQPWHGRVLRLAMLATHYRQPIDWTVDRLVQSRATLMEFADIVHGVAAAGEPHAGGGGGACRTISTRSSAMSIIHGVAKSAAAQSGGRSRTQGDACSSWGSRRREGRPISIPAAPRSNRRGRDRPPDQARARRPPGPRLQGKRPHPRRARSQGRRS